MSLPFEFASGTVMGTDHAFSRRPNQDALYLHQMEGYVIGAVCDGCGDPTSAHSEVGAQLGVRLVAKSIDLWKPWDFKIRQGLVRDRILSSLNSVIGGIAPSSPAKIIRERHYRETVRDYFLFTIVGFVITETQATFFSIGDGTVYINGEVYSPGPFPGNAPPYLAYSLLDSALLTVDPTALNFQILKEIPTEELQNFMIGSDGCQDFLIKHEKRLPGMSEPLGNINQFWMRDCYFENPLTLQRRLAVANTPAQFIDWENRQLSKYPGLLHDDVALVVGRRKVALINE